MDPPMRRAWSRARVTTPRDRRANRRELLGAPRRHGVGARLGRLGFRRFERPCAGRCPESAKTLLSRGRFLLGRRQRRVGALPRSLERSAAPARSAARPREPPGRRTTLTLATRPGAGALSGGDVSRTRRDGADRAERLGERLRSHDDRLGGDDRLRFGVGFACCPLTCNRSPAAIASANAARPTTAAVARSTFHGSCVVGVRDSTRSSAVAIHAAARSSMYWPRTSRADRCASSTLGSDAAPSRYATSDIRRDAVRARRSAVGRARPSRARSLVREWRARSDCAPRPAPAPARPALDTAPPRRRGSRRDFRLKIGSEMPIRKSARAPAGP